MMEEKTISTKVSHYNIDITPLHRKIIYDFQTIIHNNPVAGEVLSFAGYGNVVFDDDDKHHKVWKIDFDELYSILPVVVHSSPSAS